MLRASLLQISNFYLHNPKRLKNQLKLPNYKYVCKCESIQDISNLKATTTAFTNLKKFLTANSIKPLTPTAYFVYKTVNRKYKKMFAFKTMMFASTVSSITIQNTPDETVAIVTAQPTKVTSSEKTKKKNVFKNVKGHVKQRVGMEVPLKEQFVMPSFYHDDDFNNDDFKDIHEYDATIDVNQKNFFNHTTKLKIPRLTTILSMFS